MSYSADHLTAQERQHIAEGCFQVTETRGNELHGLCPFHGEKQPSFSYNIEKDLCNCFSCGASGDLITLYGQARGHADNDSAFEAFRKEYGPAPTSQPAKTRRSSGKPRGASANGGPGASEETTKIIPEDDFLKLADPPESMWQMVLAWGWSIETCAHLGIRYRTTDNRIAIPIRQDDGKLVNVRLYGPTADNKIISWGKGFGKSKLFPAPATWRNEPILICEGEKDCITALSKGFNACTQTAGCNSWDDKFNRFFDGRDVVIAYDADEKGIAGAQKVAKKLGKVAKSIKILMWPTDIMPELPDHGQDLTDFFSKHRRSQQDLRDLIQQAEDVTPQETKKTAPKGNAQRFFGGDNGRQFMPRRVADEVMTWRKLVHDHKSGRMHTWADTHWQEYDEVNIRRQILNMLDEHGQTSRVNDALQIVKDLAFLPHGRNMNDKKEYIPILTGMFNIETGEIHQHKEDNFNSYIIEIDIDTSKPLPSCDKWQAFLAESVNDAETIREIQKFFGYCLTRETRYEKMLLLIGPGGDGKGTILNILSDMVGENNRHSATMTELHDQFHRVELVDKLLNVSTEIDSTLLQSDMLKMIVSGESISAAYKHRNVFKFIPTCKLAFSSNKHPKIQDTSDGLYRRLMVIEMDKQFVKAGRANLYLHDELREELSGIFLWALRGLQMLREDKGFTPSRYMLDCLETFKEVNNPILLFVKTHIEHDKGAWAGNMDIYKKYKGFCEARGHKPLAEAWFGIELKKSAPFIKKKRESSGKRRWGYENMRLVDDYANF